MGAIEAVCHYDSDSFRSSTVRRAQKSLEREEMNIIEGHKCCRVQERREERQRKSEDE